MRGQAFGDTAIPMQGILSSKEVYSCSRYAHRNYRIQWLQTTANAQDWYYNSFLLRHKQDETMKCIWSYQSVENTIHTHVNKKLVSNRRQKVKIKVEAYIYIGTFRVESLLPLSRSLLSADQLQIINFVKHGNNWKLENSYLFKNKKLTWSGRHLQHAPWKLQQTFLWYRSTTWQIYQRRHWLTIAHQVKSTHGSQAANRNTDKRITTNAYKVQFFFSTQS